MTSRWLLAATILATPTVAAADGFDAERFLPANGAAEAFTVERPLVPFHLGFGLGLFFNLADDPVVELDDADEVISRPVDTALTADLLGSIGFFDRLELGVALPVHLIYDGDDGVIAGGEALAASGGVGDLRLTPKALLLARGDADLHYLVGLAVPVTLPTGDAAAFRGADGISVGPRLLLSMRAGSLELAANAGVLWRSTHPQDLPWANEVTVSAAVAYALSDALSLHGEVIGAKHFSTAVDGEDLPIELLGGVVYRVSDNLGLYGGAAIGLSDGLGTPDFRAVAGVRYSSRVPPNDGFDDSDGDGLIDRSDDCPDEPEDEDGFQDDDGCPEPDNDGDGIADEDDECPELPEEQGGDGDGCPEETYVKIVDGQLVVFGKVQFATGRAEIQPKSENLLDQVATALKANPDIGKVRIEGHTDNVGGTENNLRLSEQRARSVKRALVERGIDEDRLRAEGLGESQPLAPNNTRAGRAKNRRVEFIIE